MLGLNLIHVNKSGPWWYSLSLLLKSPHVTILWFNLKFTHPCQRLLNAYVAKHVSDDTSLCLPDTTPSSKHQLPLFDDTYNVLMSAYDKWIWAS